MIKVCCLSDLHGNLDLTVKKSDLLIIAGDICPAYHDPYRSFEMQYKWMSENFSQWIKKQPIKKCVLVFGNHDWIGESSNLLPKLSTKVNILEDAYAELFGLKIYGTPYQLSFNNWAFNRTERELEFLFDKVPGGLDILISHSPPFGIFDEVNEFGVIRHIGSISLMKRIKEVKPKYAIFGHNHSRNGVLEEDGTIFINCSMLNEKYELVKEPIYFSI